MLHQVFKNIDDVPWKEAGCTTELGFLRYLDDLEHEEAIRMFGPRGNPQARNLFGIIGYLQKQAGVELHVMQGPRQSENA